MTVNNFTYELLKKINTLSRTIEVLLTVLHYEQCKNVNCKNGEICVDKKLYDLNINVYGNSEIIKVLDDIYI